MHACGSEAFATHENRLSHFLVGANLLASPILIAQALGKAALIYSEMKRNKKKNDLLRRECIVYCGEDATD